MATWTVTYPDATTWQATTTGLGAGANSVTVSDGTDSAGLSVEGPVVADGTAVSSSGSMGPVGWLISQGIPLRESSGNKWRPVRLRSNGSLVYLRRS